MKTIQKAILVCALASLSGIAVADDYDTDDDSYAATSRSYSYGKGCSLRDVVGRWVFASAISRQMAPIFPVGKDMTALGTMNIERDGTLSGTFDLTVQDFEHYPQVGYVGSIVINRDCTGTVTFVTEFGSSRTDSIAVVGRGEILGMSKDPANLLTYQVRRVGHLNRKRD